MNTEDGSKRVVRRRGRPAGSNKGARPEPLDYKVGDIIEYRTTAQEVRIVRVLRKCVIFAGKNGFEGLELQVGWDGAALMSSDGTVMKVTRKVWGFDYQVSLKL